MNFINIREFRANSGKIWKALRREQELVITSNGKPIAILSNTSAESLVETLNTIKKSRAQLALGEIRKHSLETGTDKISAREIDREISAARRGRRKAT